MLKHGEFALYQELRDFIKGKPKNESSLISILHKTQNLFGYCPQEAQELIAKELALPVSRVFGVVTFYSYFTLKPRGKYNISICLGTACYVKGAQQLVAACSKELGIENGETTKDLLFSMAPTRCLGDCSKAPVVMINDQLHGEVTEKELVRILQDLRKKEAAQGQAEVAPQEEAARTKEGKQ
ncbi:NAD-reducing hydrogenase subunit HoxE [Clostridiaceae bacterium JG1575]|nr:NAD-reducing hydrogenase subunit HoxE [Clostridiaceae bacterium JG1575]